MSAITVGITTRDRPVALTRLIESLSLLSPLDPEIIVFDDGSTPSASQTLSTVSTSLRLRVIRDDTRPAYIVGRNRIMREAATPFVLLLDDDAVLLSADPVRQAIHVLEGDPSVAAVAFAQAEADGQPWPAAMQPGSARVASLVPSYIGFAHLLRTDVFQTHGGYRELLVFYGEEKELCVRLWNEGLKVVYLPDALIAHVPDGAARSHSRYVRYAIRNDCLFSILNEPLPLPLLSIPVRLRRYASMARTVENGDSGGFGWLMRDLVRVLPEAWRLRRAVSWKTMRYWRYLGRNAVPYIAP